MLEPTAIRAGDTVEWEEDTSSYLNADGYDLKYALRCGAVSKSVPTADESTVTYDGSTATITLLPALTATLSPGYWQFQSYVEKGSGATLERHTLSSGTINVTPSLFGTASVAGATFPRRMLAAIEAVMEDRADQPQKALTANGKALEFLTPAELAMEWKRWKYEVQRGEQAERLAKGLSSTNTIKTAFLTRIV